MFSSTLKVVLCGFLIIWALEPCFCDLTPYLSLYSPGEPEYTDILVKRVEDNLTLVCEVRGDPTPKLHMWNYVPAEPGEHRVYTIEPTGPTSFSKLQKHELQVSDSGQYMCSSPPFSVTKYILVQPRGNVTCAKGAFWCGSRCVLSTYVCDGHKDCLRGEDENPLFCSERVCERSDRINCTSGRCISVASCCHNSSPMCLQPSCCNEYQRFSKPESYLDMEFPQHSENRHGPDDYGFIQSTIYTVTACALIFMIAVVLLVSAVCKMHMKRNALRNYAMAERATTQHYNLHYAQTHHFPPRYEPHLPSAPHSPAHTPVQCPEYPQEATPEGEEQSPQQCRNMGVGLSRLTSIFSSRYRQVPTQCCDVEMTNVRSTSLNNSPTRNRTLDNYRSPTYCDLNTECFINQESGARELNFVGSPVEVLRHRAMRRNTLERVLGQFTDRQRLTLHLGRFQLSLPRFGRRPSTERRPDTPNITEINIEDLDFVRLGSNDTYTLNGRTIHLLGGNFENYPVLPDGTRPPPYNEAMRYKIYGPPPEYLSREGLNSRESRNVDEEARNNVEMPPCYDELAAGVNGNLTGTTEDNGNVATTTSLNITADVNDNGVRETLNSVIDNLPAIDSDVNANDASNDDIENGNR